MGICQNFFLDKYIYWLYFKSALENRKLVLCPIKESFLRESNMQSRKEKVKVIREADALYSLLHAENKKFVDQHPDVLRLIDDVVPIEAKEEVRNTVLKIAKQRYILHDC